MRMAQTRVQVPVRLPRESAWGEKRAKPKPCQQQAPQSRRGARKGHLRGGKRTRSQDGGRGEGVAVCRMGSARQKSDALERQASLDGEVLVDGAAVEPGSLIL